MLQEEEPKTQAHPPCLGQPVTCNLRHVKGWMLMGWTGRRDGCVLNNGENRRERRNFSFATVFECTRCPESFAIPQSQWMHSCAHIHQYQEKSNP